MLNLKLSGLNLSISSFCGNTYIFRFLRWFESGFRMLKLLMKEKHFRCTNRCSGCRRMSTFVPYCAHQMYLPQVIVISPKLSSLRAALTLLPFIRHLRQGREVESKSTILMIFSGIISYRVLYLLLYSNSPMGFISMTLNCTHLSELNKFLVTKLAHNCICYRKCWKYVILQNY